MYVTEQDPHLLSDDSPWIRRCCPHSSEVGTTLERSVQDNEMQGLLCCQHNGRSAQSVPSEKQNQFASPKIESIFIVVSEQFVRFCKNTSLRGVPRIVKSKDRKLRLLWTVFFLIFLIGCFVCVVMMVRQYLDHATMEKPISQENSPVLFPSITVCNTRPYSIRGTKFRQKHGILSYFEYLSQLAYKFRVANRHFRFNKIDRRYLSNAFLLSMYLSELPKNIKPEMLGHRLNELVLSCHVMITHGSIKVNKLCHEVGTWVRTEHELYLNCYTYTVSGKENSLKTIKVNMTLYLGGNLAECQFNCIGTTSYLSQIDGVRLQIHEADTYPSVNEGGMYLSPGKFTEVEFSTRILHMKEPPYGSCSENQRKSIKLVGHVFNFSRSSCFISEVQRRILKNCNCYSSESPVPEELKPENFRSCRRDLLSVKKSEVKKQQPGMNSQGHYVLPFLKAYIKRVSCKIKTESAYELQHNGCPKRCRVTEYETSISSTKWPTRSYQDQFLCDVSEMRDVALKPLCKEFLKIMKEKYGNFSFDVSNYTSERCQADATAEKHANITDLIHYYDGILEWKKTKNDKFENATVREMKRMLRDEYFNDNMISLSVRRPHFGIKLIVEKEVITLTSLLSQVGGLLSIFIGLNFAFVVEIIELLYNIFQSVRHRKPRK